MIILWTEMQPCHAFFGRGNEYLFHCNDCFVSKVVFVDSTFVTDDDPRYEEWVINDALTKILIDINVVFFVLCGQQEGEKTKFGEDTPYVLFKC